MFKYEVTKENTLSKVKAAAKADLIAMFTEFLEEKLGAENVRMVELSGASPKRELGFRFGEVVVDGDTVPISATINPTVKEFTDHTSDKGKQYITFDFDMAANAYDTYLLNKAAKAEAAAKIKAENIAKKQAQ